MGASMAITDVDLQSLYAREAELATAHAAMQLHGSCNMAFSVSNEIFREMELVLYLTGEASNAQLLRFDRVAAVRSRIPQHGITYVYHAAWLEDRLYGRGRVSRPYVHTAHTVSTYLATPTVDYEQRRWEQLAQRGSRSNYTAGRGLFDGDPGFSRGCELWWESVGTLPTADWRY